ncbi:MAG: lecithin retinol acyltransferase family protein [Planctomycetota bacterium]
MAKGDHLVCSLGSYQHHAIDMGDGNVIQYGGPNLKSLRVEIVSLDQLKRQQEVHVLDLPASYSSDEIIERALGRMGEDNYCLFSNNCEHFVLWCRTGTAQSRQVTRFIERTISATVKLAARTTSSMALRRTAQKTIVKLAQPKLPWLIAADVAQLGTEIAASNRGMQQQQAQRLGQAAGLSTSAGIGAVAGGPLGAAAGVGVWALGEWIGQRFAKRN